jgi:hypothetical protein
VRTALLQTPVAVNDRPRGVRISGELLRVMKGYGGAVYLDKVGVVGRCRVHPHAWFCVRIHLVREGDACEAAVFSG